MSRLSSALQHASVGHWLRARADTNWVVADQALVSGCNFLTSVLLARLLGLDAYGEFVLLYAVLLYGGTFSSAVILSPMLSIAPQIGEPRRRAEFLQGTFTVQLALALTIASLITVLGTLFGSVTPGWSHGNALVALAVATACFQLQDWLRRYYFVAAKGSAVLMNDVVSYGGQLVAVAALHVWGILTAATALWAIGITSALAFLLGAAREGVRPAIRDGKAVAQAHWRASRDLLVAAQLQWIAAHGVLFIGAAALGAGAAGAIRAAANILGPANILFQAMDNIVPVQAAARFARGGISATRAYLRQISQRGLLALLVVFAIVSVLAREIMQFVYGPAFAEFALLVVIQSALLPVVFLYRQVAYFHRTVRTTESIVRSSLIMAVASVATALVIVSTLREAGILIAVLVGQACGLASAALRARDRSHGGPDASSAPGDSPWALLGSPATPPSRAGTSVNYLTLPRAGRPRWWIPARPRAAALTGLDLYVPATWAGRRYKQALRAWCRIGAPFCAKTTIVPTRQADDLRARIRKSVPGFDGGFLAVSAGTPGPRRKFTVAVMDSSGRSRAFAKAAATPLARTALATEAQMLVGLAEIPVSGGVPSLLDVFDVDGFRILLQSAGSISRSPNTLTRMHWTFLGSLVCGPEISMQHHIRSELALPARFAALVGRFDGDTLRPLQSALEVLLRTPDKRVPAAIVHGDFAPWNIGLADDEKDGHLFVYDWECGRLSGLPLIDALHFLLQTLFLLHDASPQGALRRIAQLEGDPGYRGYACAAGLDASAGRTVLLAYLVDAVLETLERDAAGGGRLRFHRLELLREVLAQ